MKQIFCFLLLCCGITAFAQQKWVVDSLLLTPKSLTYSFAHRKVPYMPDKFMVTLSNGELSPKNKLKGDGFKLSISLCVDMPEVQVEAAPIDLCTGEYKQFASEPGCMASEVDFDYAKTTDGKLTQYNSKSTGYMENPAKITIKKKDGKYTISGDKYVQIGYQDGDVILLHLIIPETEVNPTQKYMANPVPEENYEADFTKPVSKEGTKVLADYSLFHDRFGASYPTLGLIKLNIYDVPTLDTDYFSYFNTTGAGRLIHLLLKTEYGIDAEHMNLDNLFTTYSPNSDSSMNLPDTYGTANFYNSLENPFWYEPAGSFFQIYDEKGESINTTLLQNGDIKIQREDDGEYSISGTLSESQFSSQRNKEVPFSFYWKGDLLSAIQGLPVPASIDNMNADAQNSNTTVISNLLGQQVNPAGAGFKIVKEGNRVVKKFVK